jgi:hypothetical protein
MTDAHLPHALRILARDIHCEDGIATQCIREAADEIDRLRAQPCPYVTGNVTRYCTLTPFTLTDEERQAIAWVCGDVADITGPTEDTLRGLLERTLPECTEDVKK